MKKMITLISFVLTTISISSLHTNAATTVTNETDTSSMHGVNGQFEIYHNQTSAYRPVFKKKAFTITPIQHRLLKASNLPILKRKQ